MVLKNFETIDKTSETEVRKFLRGNFKDPGEELDKCTPGDWKKSPKKFDHIHDPSYRQWAMELNELWKELCREVGDNFQSFFLDVICAV